MYFGAQPVLPQVPIPQGFRRATAKEITKPVLSFARNALEHAMPIGKQQVAIVTHPNKKKQTVMALTEVHWDNHPARPNQGYKAGEGPPFQHPGISILVAKNETKAISPFQTQMPGLPTSNNEFAGEEGGLNEHEENLYRKLLWKEELPIVKWWKRVKQ